MGVERPNPKLKLVAEKGGGAHPDKKHEQNMPRYTQYQTDIVDRQTRQIFSVHSVMVMFSNVISNLEATKLLT